MDWRIIFFDFIDLTNRYFWYKFKKIFTNFITFSSSETLKQSFKISFIYLILTVIIFILLSLSGLRIFDSFNLSLTLISFGFLPDNNLSLIINGKFQQIVLSISFLLLSFFSLFLLYNLVFLKKNINFFFEDLKFLFYLLFLITIFFIFFNFDNNFSLLFYQFAVLYLTLDFH